MPRKNLQRIGGHTLLELTFEAAKASSLDRVVLSSEDAEIQSHAKEIGLEVPFSRPARLASDTATTLEVVTDALHRMRKAGPWDAVCVLQPSSFQSAGDIDRCLALLPDHDSVITVTESEEHPCKMGYLDKKGRWRAYFPTHQWARRQELGAAYVRDGGVYLSRTSMVLKYGRLVGDRVGVVVVPRERSARVDTPYDLWLAAQKLTGSQGSARLPKRKRSSRKRTKHT